MPEREFWRGKSVLVTGGTGFVGRHLTRRFEEAGAQVVSVGSRQVDLTSSEDTMRWARGWNPAPSAIFHLAVWAKPGAFALHHAAELFHINTMLNANILRAWHECAPRARFVGIGSSCAYPGHLARMAEEDFWNGEPHASVWAYAMTKRMLYAGQRAYAQQYGLDTVHVISTTLYGPGDHFDEASSHVVGALIDRFSTAHARGDRQVVVWGDGTQSREVVFIEDQIDGLLLAAERCHDALINIGTGTSHTVREIAETIARFCDYRGEIVYDTSKFVGAREKVLNIDRAVSTLGWRPKTTLEGGLTRTTAWHREHILPSRLAPVGAAR